VNGIVSSVKAVPPKKACHKRKERKASDFIGDDGRMQDEQYNSAFGKGPLQI
jgi:hypothetical protein